MAISLGDAALAFAGGAAKQYNKMADEERVAKQKRQERIQELLDQTALKQAETEYSQEVDKHHKLESLYESFNIYGGPNSALGQQAIAQYEGKDFAQVVRSGMFGKLKAPERMKAPIPLTERMRTLMASDYDPAALAYSDRVRNTTAGKLYTKDGRAIPRGVAADENGRVDPREYINAAGVGMDESAAWFQDISSLTDEEQEALGKTMLGEAPDMELTWDKDRGVMIATDKKTLETQAIKPQGLEEEKPALPDSDKLNDLQVRREAYRTQLNNTRNPAERERLQELIDETDGLIDQKINENLSPELLRIKQENQRQVAELTSKAGMLATSLTSLERYASLSTESAGGVAGLITGFKDFVGTQIRGITDMIDATQPLTAAQKEEAVNAAGVTTAQLMKSDMAIYKGMTESERVNMLYTVAGAFREMGRRDISNADVERAQDLLGKIGEGGDARVGAIRTIRNVINRRIREVNLDIYEMKGVDPEKKLQAGIAWVESPRWVNGKMEQMVRGKDYTIVNGRIGIRANDDKDSIIPLEEILRIPEARRQ